MDLAPSLTVGARQVFWLEIRDHSDIVMVADKWTGGHQKAVVDVKRDWLQGIQVIHPALQEHGKSHFDFVNEYRDESLQGVAEFQCFQIFKIFINIYHVFSPNRKGWASVLTSVRTSVESYFSEVYEFLRTCLFGDPEHPLLEEFLDPPREP